jgi:hypothetical protein
MGFCNCGYSSCRCGFITQKPYFTDVCQQQPECGEKIYVCNYSTILKVQGEWAVPLQDEIVTLNVPGLTDIIIGSAIWNPDYGSYLVVAIPADEQIKITKTEDNTTAVGTPIPSCTKFMTTLPPTALSSDWASFVCDWRAASGAGAITDITENNLYSVDGDRVDTALNSIIEITGATIGALQIDLPFQGSAFGGAGQRIACTLLHDSLGMIPGTIFLPASSNAALVFRTDGVSFAIGIWTIQQNFFYKKGT